MDYLKKYYRCKNSNLNHVNSYYFFFNKSNSIRISDFILIEDSEEIKEVEKIFSNEICSEVNRGVIIPLKYLNEVSLNSSLFWKVNIELYRQIIEVILQAKNVNCTINIIPKYQVLEKWLSMLPLWTQYYIKKSTFRGDLSANLYENIKKLSWIDKRVCTIFIDYRLHFYEIILIITNNKFKYCL